MYNAIITNIISYALPVWAGFLMADLTNRINTLLKKCHIRGFSLQQDTVSKLLEQADSKLFTQLQKPNHCAHYLLPPRKQTVRSLRPRLHNYQLPACHYKLYKNSFICRYLYCNCIAK